jgi:hypothetical protein
MKMNMVSERAFKEFLNIEFEPVLSDVVVREVGKRACMLRVSSSSGHPMVITKPRAIE